MQQEHISKQFAQSREREREKTCIYFSFSQAIRAYYVISCCCAIERIYFATKRHRKWVKKINKMNWLWLNQIESTRCWQMLWPLCAMYVCFIASGAQYENDTLFAMRLTVWMCMYVAYSVDKLTMFVHIFSDCFFFIPFIKLQF